MKNLINLFMLCVLLLSGCVPLNSGMGKAPIPDYWPTHEWRNSSPESQGIDSDQLARMYEHIIKSQANLYSVLIVRNGYVVTEAYFHPYTRDTKVHVQSITKSVIGMLVGRAIQTGAISSVDDSLVSFFPGRVFTVDEQAKEKIHLRHLLSMTSGLDCQEFSAQGPKMEQSGGWVQFMLDLPVVSTPGKKFNYCNGNAHLLSAILEKTTGMKSREFANQELFAPLGIPPVDEVDWGSDPKGYTIGGYGLHLRPIDLAKLALLFLSDGKWEDQQLLANGWVAESTTQHILKEDRGNDEGSPGYGYLWTVYPDQGRYAALGLGGQQIHVFPSKSLVVVFTAGLPAYAEAPEIETLLSEYILPAVKSNTALPENPQGVSRLQAMVDLAANPIQPVPELPTTALTVTDSVYNFEENPIGWQKMRFTFVPGANTARLHFNDTTSLEIGLDNIYRLSNSPVLGQVLLRARWEDDQTFVADYPYAFAGLTKLGELGETKISFQFTGDILTVTITPQIFGGQPLIIVGKR